MRVRNGSLASPPPGADPAADSDLVLIAEEDYSRPTCAGAGQFETLRLGADSILRPIDDFVVETDPSRPPGGTKNVRRGSDARWERAFAPQRGGT